MTRRRYHSTLKRYESCCDGITVLCVVVWHGICADSGCSGVVLLLQALHVINQLYIRYSRQRTACVRDQRALTLREPHTVPTRMNIHTCIYSIAHTTLVDWFSLLVRACALLSHPHLTLNNIVIQLTIEWDERSLLIIAKEQWITHSVRSEPLRHHIHFPQLERTRHIHLLL